ncbi:MAG: isoprenylcysteine carboxylmethyltransferase family protein [Proteobacteria bacterium]|nr:MAG: isoprenylcysteine carboxylmethyltransferase family protein [Pseudomonadota bacterium]
MVDITVTTLFVANFLYVVLLPKIFFRQDGKLNLMWWVTGAPYGLAPFVVILFYLGYLPTDLIFSSGLVQNAIAVVISTLSISLISYTLGTHRIPLALWHQKNDAPQQIVTWGAYKYIRHPFYTSFLLALFAVIVAIPSIPTILIGLYGAVILTLTASREEKKLSESQFGADYVKYKKSTGRFLPRLSKES